MRGSGKYDGGDIDVTFAATGVWSSYGERGSPEWIDWDNFEIEALTILGVDVDPKALPDDLRRAIEAMAYEVEFTSDD